MTARPTVGEATDARHAAFFEWLVEWRNVGNLYEFAGPYPILQGGTAREADSLPYKSVCENLPAKFQFDDQLMNAENRDTGKGQKIPIDSRTAVRYNDPTTVCSRFGS